MHIRERTDIMARNFLWDYDVHRRAANRLHLYVDQVAEEYGDERAISLSAEAPISAVLRA